MDKPASRRNELYVLITIIIAICSCCGTWMAVPQLRPVFEKFAEGRALQVSTPSGDGITSEGGDIYTVTIINDAAGYLRFDNTYIVAPQQLITFEIGTGLHKVPIDYSYNGGNSWGLNNSLELDLDRDVTYRCRDRSVFEQAFKAFGVIFGFVDFEDAYGVNCKLR